MTEIIDISQRYNYDICIKTRQIFLYPDISTSDLNLDISIKFIKNFSYLENINKNNIIIHTFNYGGEWDAGFAIYDIIKNSECFVTIITHGTCQSIGCIILQAADLRLAMRNCDLLIHEGHSGIHSELSHKAAKSWAINEHHKEELLYDILTEKCMEGSYFKERKYKKNRIKAYLKTQIAKQEDWILSPLDAKDYGFIDGIIGETSYPNLNSLIK